MRSIYDHQNPHIAPNLTLKHTHHLLVPTSWAHATRSNLVSMVTVLREIGDPLHRFREIKRTLVPGGRPTEIDIALVSLDDINLIQPRMNRWGENYGAGKKRNSRFVPQTG